MSPVLLFVALVLASYRVFRLIGRDDITEPIRSWLFFGKPEVGFFGWLQKWIVCEWCAGTWVSLAAVYSTHRWLEPLQPHWLLWSIAVASVVGFLGLLDGKLSE